MHHKATSVNHKTVLEHTAPPAEAAADQHCWAQDMMLPDPVFLREESTILDAIKAFHKQRLDTILVVRENEHKDGFELMGRICIKDVFRLLFPCLLQKDLAIVNHVTCSHVKQILIPRPQTVGPWSGVKQVLSIMLHDQTQVVGVEQNGKLIGQVFCTGPLRLFSHIAEEAYRLHQLLSQVSHASARVSEAVAGHILCLSPRDDIAKAICVVLSTTVRHIPVLNKEAKLESILSQCDVLDYIVEMLDPASVSVFEKKDLILDKTIGGLIFKDVTIIPWNTGLVEAATKMVQNDILCLAVTDVRQKFHGIVSCAEILRWFRDHLPA
jgi:acetoin utilization protein AcuB